VKANKRNISVTFRMRMPSARITWEKTTMVGQDGYSPEAVNVWSTLADISAVRISARMKIIRKAGRAFVVASELMRSSKEMVRF
jgi:hypothetical protein